MPTSVIVVSFNGREFLGACLSSIPFGVETVVVDNGSTDGSADEVAGLFPGLKLIRNAVNRGFAAAVNQGIAASTGSFICLLNSDARLSPDALQALSDYLQAHPEAAAASPQLIHEDGRRQHSFDNIPSLATAFLNKSLLRRLFPERYPGKAREYTQPLEVESVIGACMMIRREVVDRIGALDETFFLFLEETDWCLRAREAGFRIVFVPSAKVVHLQGKSRDKVATRARIEYTRSFFAFFRKNNPASYALLRLGFPIKNCAELILLTLGAAFSGRARRRWLETCALLGWQALGCPRSQGLAMVADTKYRDLPSGWRAREEHSAAFADEAGSAVVIKDLRHKKTVEERRGGGAFLIRTYKPSLLRGLKERVLGSKPARELKMSQEVERRGIPCAPVAAISRDSVAVLKLTGWVQLQEVLLSDSTPGVRRRLLCFEYGRFARFLHDRGIWQYDFNPSNILVEEGSSRFRVIDFEKMKVYGRLEEESRLRSIAKISRIPKLNRGDRLRFLKGYLHPWPSEGKRWKEIARLLLAFARKQAAHDAARAGRRCVEENRDFGKFEHTHSSGFYLKRRPERPLVGMTPEEVAILANLGALNGKYRIERAPHALAAWSEANEQARRGGPVPIAVVIGRGGSEGTILYPGTFTPSEKKT